MSEAVIVKAVDMPEGMKKEAVRVGQEAVDKCQQETEIASFIKEKFDELHGGPWHCVIGKNFGSFVTHQPGRFIYMYVVKVAILLFKSAC